MEDGFNIPITDLNGKEYKARVLDIFSVKEYPDNDYIMYSIGKGTGDKIQVNVSRVIINEDKGLDLVGIEDDKEWDIVNSAIDEHIAMLGGLEDA